MSKTIKVSKETHERLTETKPYDSLSYGEFIEELLGQYEPPRVAAGEVN